MKFQVTIIRSKRKSIGLEIKSPDELLVRAPMRISKQAIEREINAHTDWIIKHMEKKREQLEKQLPSFSDKEILDMKAGTRKVIPLLVDKYADILGVSYEKISIRCQKTLWGSCTSKGNLSFNCLLIMCPIPVMEYVVVHELAHRKEMNHSKQFWEIVESVIPDYKERRAWLKNNGNEIIARISVIEKTGNCR